ncbi:MAG: hypothetical protein JJLCMIEE_02195 [Acidimicrobiales bacterium]|nr:hypothetical protein [Acidimicrobiales bacterium]
MRGHRWLSEVAEVTGDIGRDWKADRVSSLGAEIAFWGVLAIFPALLAVTAMIGSLETITGAGFAEQARETITEGLDRLFGGNEAAMAPFLDILNSSNAGVAVVGLVGALYTTSRGVVAAINGLTVVYDVPETRSWLRLRLLAFGLSFAAVVAYVLVLAVFILGPLLGLADDVDSGASQAVWSWVRGPFLVVALAVGAATLMHMAPSRRSPWRWDLPGALLSTVFWGLAVVGFRIYITVASRGNEVYGVIGGAITLMLFMYIMSIGLLVGGVLNSVLIRRYGPVRPTGSG